MTKGNSVLGRWMGGTVANHQYRRSRFQMATVEKSRSLAALESLQHSEACKQILVSKQGVHGSGYSRLKGTCCSTCIHKAAEENVLRSYCTVAPGCTIGLEHQHLQ